ncbi:OmpA family protein [Flavobacterium sp.]|uniref:OmpA family protein n=1 Tax=Flavobacterium sp. TaxID=239 RepID=UPI0026179479|nr:OmpA family protein [Flavobacterium sp.]
MNKNNQLPNKIIAHLTLLLLVVNSTFTQAQEEKKTQPEPYAPSYTLYYPTDQWELTTENSDFLATYVLQELQRTDAPNLVVQLEGHTDDVGTSYYNTQLSQKRVQAVADFLIKNGFKPEQIKINFFGESKPETRKIASSNKLQDIRYANRRVTIKIEKR